MENFEDMRTVLNDHIKLSFRGKVKLTNPSKQLAARDEVDIFVHFEDEWDLKNLFLILVMYHSAKQIMSENKT